jgi:uncharacterized protein YaaN involved in tellurite resistance
MNDIKKSIEVLKEQIIKNEKILDGLPEKARAGATDLSNVVKACHVAISALEKQLNGGWIPASDGKYIIEVKEGEVVSCQNFEI